MPFFRNIIHHETKVPVTLKFICTLSCETMKIYNYFFLDKNRELKAMYLQIQTLWLAAVKLFSLQ